MVALGGLLMLFVISMAAAAVAYYGTMGAMLALLWLVKAVFRCLS